MLRNHLYAETRFINLQFRRLYVCNVYIYIYAYKIDLYLWMFRQISAFGDASSRLWAYLGVKS